MAADLRGIPGAGRDRPSRRVRTRTGAGRLPPLAGIGSPLGPPVRSRRGGRGRPPRRRRSIPWSSILIALGFAALGAFVWREFWGATRVHVAIEGIADEAQLTRAAADDLDVKIHVEELDLEAGITPTLFFDGFPVAEEEYEVGDEIVRWRPGRLEEGEHELQMSVGRPLLDDATFSWRFVVDETPPRIDVASPTPPVDVCAPVEVAGRVEPGLAEATVDGEELDAADDGSFTLRFDQPPTGPILLRARDVAGNEAAAEIVVPVRYPSTQGIHVSAAAWGYGPLREHVMEIVDAGLVSAVQLDIKDEGGIVGYDTGVDLAHEIGAVREEFDLEEAVDLLHDKGVRVIGRIVAFRDGPLARWAWDNGHRDWVVQDAQGQMLSKYGGFTNVASAEVRRYNIDLAIEAAELGVDDILWDYVRRPEGSIDGMRFPGLQGSVNDSVVGFLAEAADPLRDACVYQGASLFGVAARSPDAIGQPVPDIARHVDYIAPMLYPSHWVRGEYRVDHPNAQPYEIITKSLADFQRKAAGSGVSFNLWVQDFSIGVPYGPAEVRAQIDAARALGVDSWLLWNATVRYTTGALDPSLVSRDGEPPPAPPAAAPAQPAAAGPGG